MKNTKVTESQLVAALRKQESGVTSIEVSRKPAMSEATFYSQKSRYGVMQVNNVKKMKDMEDELSQYKRIDIRCSQE